MLATRVGYASCAFFCLLPAAVFGLDLELSKGEIAQMVDITFVKATARNSREIFATQRELLQKAKPAETVLAQHHTIADAITRLMTKNPGFPENALLDKEMDWQEKFELGGEESVLHKEFATHPAVSGKFAQLEERVVARLDWTEAKRMFSDVFHLRLDFELHMTMRSARFMCATILVHALYSHFVRKLGQFDQTLDVRNLVGSLENLIKALKQKYYGKRYDLLQYADELKERAKKSKKLTDGQKQMVRAMVKALPRKMLFRWDALIGFKKDGKRGEKFDESFDAEKVFF